MSIEVDPRIAHDTDEDHRRGQGAVVARRPAERDDQDPGDRGGPGRRSPAATADGISVNVTLIFGLDRYDEVMDAYLTGLEQAKETGIDLSTIRSVASFFVSPRRHRDRQAAGQDRHRRGQGAARQGRASPTPGWPTSTTRRSSPPTAGRRSRPPARTRSARCGPRPASRTRPTTTRCTSSTWSRPNTVNTMPEATLDAVADHGAGHAATRSRAPTTTPSKVLDDLDGLGHRLRRRRRGARGRGRAEVRGLLGAAARGRAAISSGSPTDRTGRAPTPAASEPASEPAKTGRADRANL